jgi:hypothetical protein
MSKYSKTTTVFNDEECLVNALVDIGYDRSKIEVHKQAVPLVDYRGRQTHYTDAKGDKANVIIRSRNIGYGSANDLGFQWNEATKTYDAFISEYDRDNGHWGPQSVRFKKLKAAHAEQRGIKTAKKNGFRFLGRQIVNGKVQLQFLDPRAVTR